MSIRDGYSEWQRLDDEHVSNVVAAPGALQLATFDRRLVIYPRGKSTMVYYCYASTSMRDALAKLFADELQSPGVRGHGVLAFRFMPGDDEVCALITQQFADFEARFGQAPVLNAPVP